MKKSVPKSEWVTGTIFTVGHSTLAIDAFVTLLGAYDIWQLADIRTIRKSRRNPQFSAAALDASLRAIGIAYVALPDLGGLRHARPGSINAGWRNDSFRGYADYMQTDGFSRAVDELIALGAERRTAIMCAEAVPWRCHRSLVADALTVRGVPVVEILSISKWRVHSLTTFAHVEGRSITYPAIESDV